MSNKTQQLKANLQQQTKRLLDQLNELQQNKSDLTEEEYTQLKNSTLQQLKTFQNSLNKMLSDPTNSVLQSQIEKTKRAIFDAVKQQHNKEQIVDKLLSGQAKGARETIKQLQKKYQLKTLSQPEYVGKKRKLIVEIQQTGAKLTPEQAEWLKLHHHFSNTSNQEVKQEIQKTHMKIAQSKMEGHI